MFLAPSPRLALLATVCWALVPPPAGSSRQSPEPVEAAWAGGDLLPEAGEEVVVGEVPTAGPMRFDRGQGFLPVQLPGRETLEFDVTVDLGILGAAKAGTVVLRAGTERAQRGLPLPGVAPAAGATGYIESHARGKHLGYSIDHVLLTRILPQEWPWIFFRDTQRGSENRRREMKIGRAVSGSGAPRDVIEAAAERSEKALDSWYRNNGHCKGCERREHFVESRMPWNSDHHCDKCKRPEHRVWKEPSQRVVPEGTVDMLSAIFLARALVAEGLETVTFPMLDKTELWNVTLKRGSQSVVKTPVGEFDCTEVLLSTAIPEGEPRDEDEEFSGMFGIHGTIRIFIESRTGVPVTISGSVPVGPLDLDANVRLVRYEGTPPEFAPRAADATAGSK